MLTPDLAEVVELYSMTLGFSRTGAHRSPGSPSTCEACIQATLAKGTSSNVGYHGHGEFLQIPRVDWGMGMRDKTVRTGFVWGEPSG